MLFFFFYIFGIQFSIQIEERYDFRHYLEVEAQPKIQTETESVSIEPNYSKCFDDDGRLKRTGLIYC